MADIIKLVTKKRLLIGLLSLAVAVSCLIIVTSSASQLPPNVVKPNSKPALSANQNKSTLSVTSAPAQAADLAVSKTDSSKTSAKPAALSVAQSSATTKNCDTTNQTASMASSGNTVQKPLLTNLSDNFGQTVSNLTGLQLPKTDSLLGL